MNKQTLRHILAMVAMLCVWAAMVAQAGCAVTEATHTAPDGFSVTWKSKTLWKDVQGAEAQWGDFSARLGRSNATGQEAVIACLIAPDLDGCP